MTFLIAVLGPLNLAQHSPKTRPSVERTADKAFLLSDRLELSSAEARVEEIKGGSLQACNPTCHPAMDSDHYNTAS